MDPARRQIVFINVAHLLTHYCLLILPTAVLVIVAQGGAFGTEYGPILALATSMFVLYGLLSLPQGWFAAKVGRHRMITVFFLGTGASLVACGFAPTPGVLAICLGATGVFAAIYHPIGTAMLVETAGDRPGRALGMNGVCGNFGVSTAPVLTAFLAAWFGWQSAFIVPGLVCVTLGLVWMRLPVLDSTAAGIARPFPAIPRGIVRRAVISLLLIAIVSGLVFNAFTLLIPKLMQERLAADPHLLPLVGGAAFVATLCGAVAHFTVGRLIDRTTLRRVFLPLTLVLVPAMATLALVQGWLVVPVAGLVSAVVFGQVTVNEAMTARYIAPALRARMYSWRFFVGFLGSAAAAPLVGLLHEHTGNLAAPTLVLAAAALVTLGCALMFPDRPEELRPELWTESARRTGAPDALPAE
jgi:MFS family permease